MQRPQERARLASSSGSGHEAPGDEAPGDEAPGDDAPANAPATGENLCPDCRGTGVLDGKPCATCEGTGRVTQGIGGG
ncbi:hypothetical protein [Paraburkholderia kururiensis]|uniref:Molecular chaperone DnaJ n=1 Tax=Paraburkholderia kururiensis TaxID=984307 RepID=A0ABZ0WPT2_9BURK|nr:hypothetical protein [Paraburkholderia kururiensis]WQD79266.1 hypothetical protein U0042_06060 [Paraburkholderia kururiensis]